MHPLNSKTLGWTLSIFFAFAFAVCFFWSFTLAGELRELQVNSLRIAFLKFSGLDGTSFILGLVQSFIWGWLAALVFGWLWNRFQKTPAAAS